VRRDSRPVKGSTRTVRRFAWKWTLMSDGTEVLFEFYEEDQEFRFAQSDELGNRHEWVASKRKCIDNP